MLPGSIRRRGDGTADSMYDTGNTAATLAVQRKTRVLVSYLKHEYVLVAVLLLLFSIVPGTPTRQERRLHFQICSKSIQNPERSHRDGWLLVLAASATHNGTKPSSHERVDHHRRYMIASHLPHDHMIRQLST